ncbi:MAG: PfkB family carbohydrate kinase [Kiritimatiellae bacterium]|nr:PfkB family carbohydrate kinase [Kiritimatiellia bacterium]MDD5521178.1 PfkB family carbohydrate kinase [Kiritimatiellia bacterium]
MSTDVLILNTAVLDLRSPAFEFVEKLVGAGGLAKCKTPDMPAYTQEQIKAWIDKGCATAGGPGNTAPLIARAGFNIAVGVNLGKGNFGGLDIQGRTFHDVLTGTGVDMSAVYVHPSLPTGTTFIYEAPSNERGGIAYFPNANDDFDFEYFKGHVKRLKPRVVYYMYSGLSERGDANGGKDLADFVSWCRQQGCIVIVDSHTLTGNPKELIDNNKPLAAYNLLLPLLGNLDIFFTSDDESRMIQNTLDPEYRKRKHGDKDNGRCFLDFVTAKFTGKGEGRARLFGVTVSNGAYARFVSPDNRIQETIFCPSRFMAGEVVDLVGAGDSFRAGLIAYIVKQRESFVNGKLNVEEAVQMGNLVASIYIKSPLCDRYSNISDFDALLKIVRSGKKYADFKALLGALGTKS